VALSYVGKMALDWRRTPSGARRRDSAAVADAQTANAILKTTLDSLQVENGRMARRILSLEDEAAAKDRKIDELERRLNQIAQELAALKSH